MPTFRRCFLPFLSVAGMAVCQENKDTLETAQKIGEANLSIRLSLFYSYV
jgi:hypothetical protein